MKNIFKELFLLSFNLNYVLFECFNGLGSGILVWLMISGKGGGVGMGWVVPLFLNRLGRGQPPLVFALVIQG